MSKIKKLGVCFTLIILSLMLIAVPVFAASTNLIVPFTQPQLNGKNGYIEIMFRNSAGTEWAHVIGWEIAVNSNVSDCYMNITLSDDYLRFSPFIMGAEPSGVVTMYRCTSGGNFYDYYYSYNNGESHSFSVADIVSYRVYGNYGTVNISLEQIDFNINYSNTYAIQLQLQKIIELLSMGSGGGYESVDNSVSNDYANAESNALGGKSDEKIASETQAATNFDWSTIDFTKAQRVQNFFDKLLISFGTGYQSLVLLSLVLGFAAFLIGRKYG